jgi:hypothetical protein
MNVLELLGGKKAPLALTQVPIAGGTAVSGGALRTCIFVPNTLIKQSISSVMMVMLANQDLNAMDLLRGLSKLAPSGPSSRPAQP